MRYTHLSRLGLDSLQMLSVLLEERHVTQAARRCFLSQPAMSRVLERLRYALEDEILVRNGRGYERTLRGERILLELNSLLPRLESVLRGKHFDPIDSEERYRLSMTDYGCLVVLPSLIKQISSASPKSRVDALPWHEQSFEDLSVGRVDMIVTVAGLGKPSEFHSEAIFKDHFVCVVTPNHPLRGQAVSLSQYLQQRHIVVSVLQGQQSLVDQPLNHRSLKRDIGATLPFFAPALLLAANSKMILTVPSRLIPLLGTKSKVRILRAPPEIPSFKYEMIWHPRLDSDPAYQWAREQIRLVSKADFQSL